MGKKKEDRPRAGDGPSKDLETLFLNNVTIPGNIEDKNRISSDAMLEQSERLQGGKKHSGK